jgi:hypothetical protein
MKNELFVFSYVKVIYLVDIEKDFGSRVFNFYYKFFIIFFNYYFYNFGKFKYIIFKKYKN